MGSVNLDFIKKVEPHATEADPDPMVSIRDAYTYKDIKLDLQLGQLYGNMPGDKALNNTDLADIKDINAIKQSMANILTTTPGQKLLNPFLGLDLTKFLFDPITEQTGDLIARSILAGLSDQEPRIKINELLVIGDVVTHQYLITFNLSFPGINVTNIQVRGTLGTSGMTLQ
jgi:phage baseplate assembly protein W